jgi:hypothetical protein
MKCFFTFLEGARHPAFSKVLYPRNEDKRKVEEKEKDFFEQIEPRMLLRILTEKGILQYLSMYSLGSSRRR